MHLPGPSFNWSTGHGKGQKGLCFYRAQTPKKSELEASGCPLLTGGGLFLPGTDAGGRPGSSEAARQPPGCLCPWDCLGKNTGVGSHFYPRGSSNSGIEPESPAWQVGSLPSEPPGKPPFLPSLPKSASLIFPISVNGNSILLVLQAQTSQ